MKLTGTTELGVVVALVGLIAFMPKLLGFLVESQVGKAVAFGFVAYLWKQHNELVALLLAVALLRSCPAYEHAGKPDDKTMKKPSAASEETKMAMAATKGETM
jgi:hypothetical protein